MIAAGAGVVALGLAIDGAFDATALAFANAGMEAGKLAARTGISVGEITALGYAAERTGGTVEGLGTALFRMERTVTGAMEGSREAVDALRNLGLSAAQLIKLTPDEQFKRFAEAIAAIPNPAEQAARAQKIFGRGVLDILPLLKQGASGIAEFERRAQELHLPFTGEEVAQARRFHGLMVDLKGSLQRVAFEIGKVALPALERMRGTVLPFITQTIEWIGANQGLILSITKAGLALAGVGAGVVAVGVGLRGLGVAAEALRKIGFFLSPGGLLLGGLVALAAYAVYSSETLRGAFSDAWEGIVDAVKSGDLVLAGRIAFQGVKLAWLEVFGTLKDSFGELKFEFIDAMNKMVLSSGFLTKAMATFGEMVNLVRVAIGDLSADEFAQKTKEMALLFGANEEQRKHLADLLKRGAADDMAAGRKETQDEIDRARDELAKLKIEAKPFKPGAAPGFEPGAPGDFQGLSRAETAGTFSAAAAGRLAGGDAMLQTAHNTAETAKAVREMLAWWQGGES